jgi:ribonuclease D
LASWRDASARQRDIPRSFILKDAQMLTIASQEISQRSQLAAIGLHPSALRRFADELLAVLREADQGDIPEALPGAPEPALRARIKRLREYFNKLAASHELAPEVLARRRWIEALARNPESMPEPFSGWRAELIGTDLGDWL